MVGFIVRAWMSPPDGAQMRGLDGLNIDIVRPKCVCIVLTRLKGTEETNHVCSPPIFLADAQKARYAVLTPWLL